MNDETPLSLQMLIDLNFDPKDFAKAMRQLADDVESGELQYHGGGATFDFSPNTLTLNSTLVFAPRQKLRDPWGKVDAWAVPRG